jgi:hypothetical protein
LPGAGARGGIVVLVNRWEDTMRKLMAILFGAAFFAAAFAAGAALSPAERATASTTTARTATTERGDDHGGVARRARVRREAGEDVRGPCDEAEHRNDPRCTGMAAARNDDRGRGRGRGNDDGDRRGSNSGRG